MKSQINNKKLWLLSVNAALLVLIIAINLAWCKEELTSTLKSAEHLFQTGNYGQASKLFKKCLSDVHLDDANKDSIYFRLGQCADKDKKGELARYYFKQAMNYGSVLKDTTLSVSLSSALLEYEKLQKGYAAYNDGRYADVEKIILQLLEEKMYKKDRLEPLFLLGRSQVSLKQEGKAQESFRSVLKIDNHYEPFAATEAEQQFFEKEKIIFNKLPNKAIRLAKNKWTWIGVGGAAITGGIIYLIITDRDPLPKPPGFPSMN